MDRKEFLIAWYNGIMGFRIISHWFDKTHSKSEEHKRMNDLIMKLMDGAYDVHLHASPCLANRRASILEIAAEARDAGMKGFVVKDHHFPTAPAALMAREVVPEVRAVGGVTLCGSVGGLNPAAVEATLKLKGKVVWMFSLESAWMIKQMHSPAFGSADIYKKMGVKSEQPGYTVFLDSGGLKQEAKEIVALCKEYGAVLETSHLSPEEGFAMVKEARQQKMGRVVITHANQEVTPYTMQEQRELTELGATIMYCMNSYMSKPGEPGKDPASLGIFIRAVGVEHVVLATDFGLYYWPTAVEGMRMMIGTLLEQGFKEDEIRMMIQHTPERLYFG
jgi:hypothetical protein